MKVEVTCIDNPGKLLTILAIMGLGSLDAHPDERNRYTNSVHTKSDIQNTWIII